MNQSQGHRIASLIGLTLLSYCITLSGMIIPVPNHTMKEQRRHGGKAPRILKFICRRKWLVCFRLGPSLSLVPIGYEVGRTPVFVLNVMKKNKSESFCRKSTSNLMSVACHFTDWAITVHFLVFRYFDQEWNISQQECPRESRWVVFERDINSWSVLIMIYYAKSKIP